MERNSWHESVLEAMAPWAPQIQLSSVAEVGLEIPAAQTLYGLRIADLFIHLVPLQHALLPETLLRLQEKALQQGMRCIHLWEDIWYSRETMVIDRIKTLLGLNTRIYARESQIGVVSAAQTRLFLRQYHFLADVRAKYSYGLYHQGRLMALAAFSGLRPMPSRGKAYQSAELLRFVSLPGFTVVGGLSRLIRHFIRQTQPDDLMTYADRDWSLGASYEKLGFTYSGITAPIHLWVNPEDYSRYYAHRMPQPGAPMVPVFTTGNLKYHLFCS